MQWHNPVGGCTTVFSVISLLSSLQHLGVQIFTSLGSRPVLVVRRKCLSQRAWLAVWVCGYTITWLSRNLQQTVKINVGPSDSNGKRKVTTRLCWRLRLKLNAFTHITLFKYHSCSVKHYVVEVKTQKKKKPQNWRNQLDWYTDIGKGENSQEVPSRWQKLFEHRVVSK